MASGDVLVAEPSLNLITQLTEPRMSSVLRVLDVVLITSTDPERDLLAVHFQGDDFLFCGGAGFFELAETQPDNGQDGHVQGTNQLINAPIFIYRSSDLPCAPGQERRRFLADDWLYKGIHTVMGQRDGSSAPGSGVNSLGYHATGVVFDQAGNRYTYSETQNLLVSPDGIFGFISETIHVHRTDDN